MPLDTVALVIGVIGTLFGAFGVLMLLWARKQKKTPTATAAAGVVPAGPVAAPNLVISKDKTKYKQFLDEYDGPAHDLQFGNLSFRLGARNTCEFGLSEGYRIVDGKFVWDTVRIHTGVDRARGGNIKTLNDAVVSPFNFERSEYVYYGDKGYGTLCLLYNDKYDFTLRIGHMHPDTNYVPWSLEQFKARKPFKKGWLIGSAGTFGDSDGNHTHSEVCSQSGASEVLEQLLFDKYGQLVLKEYTIDEVIAYYKTRTFWKRKSEKDILEHWNGLKVAKKITFMNKYLYRKVLDNGAHITFYNSWTLFNM